jgi:hypothetical protein
MKSPIADARRFVSAELTAAANPEKAVGMQGYMKTDMRHGYMPDCRGYDLCPGSGSPRPFTRRRFPGAESLRPGSSRRSETLPLRK